MHEILSSAFVQDIAVNLAVSPIVFARGFVFGKWRGRKQASGRNLEQYDFHPFVVDSDGFPHFNLPLVE